MELSNNDIQQVVNNINLERHDTEHLHTDEKTKVISGYHSEILPTLPSHQIWCCEQGCGECKPVINHESYFTLSNRDGLILEMHTGFSYVSNCCRKELSVWDNNIDDIVEVEIIRESKELPSLK